MFLNTDNFWRDFKQMVSDGIQFVRPPQEQDYGIVAVFEDLYGNLWDLLQLNEKDPNKANQVFCRINIENNFIELYRITLEDQVTCTCNLTLY